MVKTLSLKEPLNRFMNIGKYKAKVIHKNQNKNNKREQKCLKCLEQGHTIATCENDWRCVQCKQPGHKKVDCPMDPLEEPESSTTLPSSHGQDDHGKQAELPPQDSETRDNTESRPPPPSSPRNPRKSKKTEEKRPKGQVSMDKFVKNADMTPSRHRSQSVTRSPPTPAEILHNNAKKSRHHDDSDSDSSTQTHCSYAIPTDADKFEEQTTFKIYINFRKYPSILKVKTIQTLNRVDSSQADQTKHNKEAHTEKYNTK